MWRWSIFKEFIFLNKYLFLARRCPAYTSPSDLRTTVFGKVFLVGTPPSLVVVPTSVRPTDLRTEYSPLPKRKGVATYSFLFSKYTYHILLFDRFLRVHCWSVCSKKCTRTVVMPAIPDSVRYIIFWKGGGRGECLHLSQGKRAPGSAPGEKNL